MATFAADTQNDITFNLYEEIIGNVTFTTKDKDKKISGSKLMGLKLIYKKSDDANTSLNIKLIKFIIEHYKIENLYICTIKHPIDTDNNLENAFFCINYDNNKF